MSVFSMAGLGQWVAAHYDEHGPVKWLAFALEVFAGLVLMFLMLLTCADVVGRYFFNNAVNGAVEMTEIGLALLVFAEMPLITWRGSHVVVDLLDKVMSHRMIQMLGLFSALAISGGLYFLAERMMYLASRSLRREVVTEYLEIPVGYIIQYIAVMSYVTAALMISYGIYRLFAQPRN
ncbi:TRAP transporter small permease [Oceanobacter kriegii]|uniref:TRAP transporter small permease n=1 Tax=Oceanobacter kriegii TaxID=64972 RepID=UPI001FE128A6|nr:TRAP transporter small permease [Oceanobacter kriegii]